MASSSQLSSISPHSTNESFARLIPLARATLVESSRPTPEAIASRAWIKPPPCNNIVARLEDMLARRILDEKPHLRKLRAVTDCQTVSYRTIAGTQEIVGRTLSRFQVKNSEAKISEIPGEGSETAEKTASHSKEMV